MAKFFIAISVRDGRSSFFFFSCGAEQKTNVRAERTIILELNLYIMPENQNCDEEFKHKFPDKWLANEKSMRSCLSHKYWLELGTLIVALATIVILAFFNKIIECTTGTLIGVVVGYCLKGLRKLHRLIKS